MPSLVPREQLVKIAEEMQKLARHYRIGELFDAVPPGMSLLPPEPPPDATTGDEETPDTKGD